MKSSIATRAAAPPPTALKSETSCGMFVIGTVRAVHRPSPPPIAKPTTMIAQAATESPSSRRTRPMSVAPIATVMPPADRRLPFRALAGEFMRWRPSTKQTAPPSWAMKTRVWRVSLSTAAPVRTSPRPWGPRASS